MKNTIALVTVFLLSSCGENVPQVGTERYIVETTVQLKKDATNEVLELFKSTNPELVRDEPDWIRATFSTISAEDLVIVRAEWKSKESYVEFSNSEKFKETMGKFGNYFAEKPKVIISKVLFEM